MTLSLTEQEEIRKLAKQGMTYNFIAKFIDRDYYLVKRFAMSDKQDRKSYTPNNRELRDTPTATDDDSLMHSIRLTLGSRYKEIGGNMYLDGKHAFLGDVVKAANVKRRAHLLPQLSKNPSWHVSN